MLPEMLLIVINCVISWIGRLFLRAIRFVRTRISIVLALAICPFAIYGTWSVLYTCLYDNEYTLLSIRYVKDVFPYLHYDPMEICLLYEPRMFGENGYQETLISIEFSNKLNASELSEMGDLLRDVQRLDDEAIWCATKGDETACSLSSTLDDTIRRRAYMVSLEDDVWPMIEEAIIRRWPFVRVDKYSAEPEYSLLHFNSDSVCLKMNLSRVLRKNAEVGRYSLGLIGSHAAIANSTNGEGRQIRITFRNTNGNRPASLSTLTKKRHRLTIDPAMLIDFSKLDNNCAKDSKIFYRSRFDGSDDARQYYLLFLATECGCVAYSYRRQFADQDSYSAAYDQLPFCTAELYNGCVGRFAATLDTKRVPRRCIRVKNTIEITSDDLLSPSCFQIDAAETCANSIVLFDTYADEYEVHEQLVRYTWPDAVCMIGGYIGVTGGCSVYSVVMSLLVWWIVWRRRRRRIAMTSDRAGIIDEQALAEQRDRPIAVRVSDLENEMATSNSIQRTYADRLNELTERMEQYDELMRGRLPQHRGPVLPPIQGRNARARRREARRSASEEKQRQVRRRMELVEDDETCA